MRIRINFGFYINWECKQSYENANIDVENTNIDVENANIDVENTNIVTLMLKMRTWILAEIWRHAIRQNSS